MNSTRQNANAGPLDAIEARVALRMASGLSRQCDALPHEVTERLRIAREQALDRAKAARRAEAAAASTAVVAGRASAAAVMGGSPSFWIRLASLMPLVVLAAGLVLIQQHHDHEQIVVAAEIDAALLSDELPPAAYRDPGFAEYLRAEDAP